MILVPSHAITLIDNLESNQLPNHELSKRCNCKIKLLKCIVLCPINTYIVPVIAQRIELILGNLLETVNQVSDDKTTLLTTRSVSLVINALLLVEETGDGDSTAIIWSISVKMGRQNQFYVHAII